ncbi:hypothetical protein [uncultured Treponema sp.]|uniref:hypothetical protein n=1 Tax=uncultured Treponema sp. TaxID=162155 RepID=UPI0025E7FA54|nr:hypothetical protein [uncultured Treponema sp.]
MKLENNNVKIEITETENGKICIDITTSKEVVVNVKNDKISNKTVLVESARRIFRKKFSLTGVVIRDSKNNKEQ